MRLLSLFATATYVYIIVVVIAKCIHLHTVFQFSVFLIFLQIFLHLFAALLHTYLQISMCLCGGRHTRVLIACNNCLKLLVLVVCVNASTRIHIRVQLYLDS